MCGVNVNDYVTYRLCRLDMTMLQLGVHIPRYSWVIIQWPRTPSDRDGSRKDLVRQQHRWGEWYIMFLVCCQTATE